MADQNQNVVQREKSWEDLDLQEWQEWFCNSFCCHGSQSLHLFEEHVSQFEPQPFPGAASTSLSTAPKFCIADRSVRSTMLGIMPNEVEEARLRDEHGRVNLASATNALVQSSPSVVSQSFATAAPQLPSGVQHNSAASALPSTLAPLSYLRAAAVGAPLQLEGSAAHRLPMAEHAELNETNVEQSSHAYVVQDNNRAVGQILSGIEPAAATSQLSSIAEQGPCQTQLLSTPTDDATPQPFLDVYDFCAQAPPLSRTTPMPRNVMRPRSVPPPLSQEDLAVEHGPESPPTALPTPMPRAFSLPPQRQRDSKMLCFDMPLEHKAFAPQWQPVEGEQTIHWHLLPEPSSSRRSSRNRSRPRLPGIPDTQMPAPDGSNNDELGLPSAPHDESQHESDAI